MNVETMRKVDRYAGIPLTFLLSIIVNLLAWVLPSRRKQSADLSRTLLIELSEMGSAIIVDPAMRKLQQQANAELYFAIFKDNAKSLAILNTVPKENIFLMRADNFLVLLIDIIKFMFWSHRHNITTTIDLELFSRFTALLSVVSGAKARVGFATLHDEGCYRGNLITHPDRYNSHVHIVENFIALTNTALGLNLSEYPTYPIKAEEKQLQQLSFDADDHLPVKQKLLQIYPHYDQQRIVLINPNASELLPQRRWLKEYFAEVISAILQQFDDVLVVVTGAPAERQEAQSLIELVQHDRCVNSAGVFSFEQLLPLYDLATLMLTNDSGPGHFSAVTKLKVFVLFGPETPALYGSLGNAENFYLALPCSPCVSAHNHRKTSCTSRPCITGITPDMVLAKLLPCLQQIPLQSTE